MKKITIISIILVLILIGPLASQGIIFEDDFESYTVGTFPSSNWNLKYSGSGTENQIIVNDQYVSPTQSLKLECAPNWAGTADVQLSYTPSIVYCEGYVKAEHEFGGPDFGFQNPDIGPWGTVYANVGVCKDGNIICNNQVLQTSEANRWYHIKIKYNSCLDLCDVWIDGVLKGKDIACSTNGEYTILRLSTYNSSASTKGWYDDIKVYGSSGWNREGYDLGWSYHYPFDTDIVIQNIPFGVDWSISVENPLVLTGDVNGDLLMEIVYTSNNILHVLDGNGNELWNLSLGFIEGYRRGILEDVTGDGIKEIIIGTRVNTTLKLLFYDGSGNLIKEITEIEGVSEDNHIHARAVTDIDSDGDLEVVALRLSGYDLWSRGVEVFDYNSGNREWFYSIGPGILTLNVADITGDLNKEILIGTGGPCNGHSVNGYSDCSCYAICLDKDGNLLWSRQFEGSGFVDSEVSVDDLDGDGKNEVIYTSREHGWGAWDGNLGRIYLLNPDNGEIVKEYNAGKPLIVNGIADITGDSNKEILVTYKDGSTQTGKILMFDDKLNLLFEYSVTGSALRVCAINDLNGDGDLEIIVKKVMFDEFVVLDDSLNELWSVQYDDDVLDVIPTDLNNDGINELIVSTENTLQVREFKFMPSFAIDLNDQVACKNDSIAFEVIVEGSLPIDYQWQKDNINIPGAMESTLILPDVQAEDGGEYRCIATNDYGSDTSNAALLTIEFAIPTNITGPTNVIEYQVVLYSVAIQEGHTYEFMVEGGNIIDVTENTIKVHWGTAGQGFVELLETSELGCYADTITLNVTIGNLSIDDYETHNLSVYPNPFTSTTTIEYTLKQPSYVQIIIYNHLGEQIDIICKNQSQGLQKVVWNAKGLPAGIYYFRIQVGDQVVAKKIIKQ